ncbi:bifunctional non-homologous end joining protein LigD [Evansella vedderi]|uniref:Bifunctional non-homologous end joining protein LigD n=2 Tax=Evansella vedderi TaxID=38282 RepID=A0ABU0A5W0_9BACI|nr:bifunctional non-homologous end joining protein LigD [Evansella vedderi]
MKKTTAFLEHLSKTKTKFIGSFFITGFIKESYQITIGIRRNNEIINIGSFSNGLEEKEKNALVEIIMRNKKSDRGSSITIDPGICVELQFNNIIKDKLQEPKFLRFRTDMHWENCTWGQLILDNTDIHKDVNMTNPNKPVWEDPFVNKEQFISYLHEISPYILPFLAGKILTVIRYPHGIRGEAFYQKNSPEYAPNFIQTYEEEGINYIHCKDKSTLLWLGNQLALEYHIPFHPIGSSYPSEIVFDLDPPSVEYFELAVKAANEMHKLFEKFNITSFPKLSGNKGLQIHIPILHSPMSYEDTRVFTSFIAKYLVETHPEDFTIERMKKNRGNKLYIDYVQHWYGKTIISPYSTRGKEGAKVAAPLFWKEVNKSLEPSDFNIFSIMPRIKKLGCPWKEYFDQENSSIREIIDSLKKQK